MKELPLKTRILVFLAALFSLLSLSAYAADVDKNYDLSVTSLLNRRITQADYPNAGAVIIRNEETVRVNADGSSVSKYRKTSKIFNARGRSYADVSISFNAVSESITDIHARTILPTGKVIPLKDTDIHQGSPYADYTLYSDAQTMSFSMPGVEDGAIVDLTYTRTSSIASIAGQYSEHWRPRKSYDPVLLSRFVVTVPASMVLHLQSQNGDKIRYTAPAVSTGKTKTYRWETDDLPAITPELLMPSDDVLFPSVDISTIPSWQNVAHWYNELVTQQMQTSPEIKSLVKQLTQDKKTDTEKAQALFYWVESKTRYVAIESGLSAVQPHPAPDVCRNRYGDCKDMATLLLTMLHEAGIKTAWPVLLAMGSRRSLHESVPNPGAFNHALVRADIDGKPLWFDCTAAFTSYGAIPGGDRGADALVIRDGIGTFETIPLPRPSDNVTHETTKVVMQPDGSADCEDDLIVSGDVSLLLRSIYGKFSPDQVKQALQNFVLASNSNAELNTYAMVKPDDLSTEFHLHVSYHTPVYANKVGSQLIIPAETNSPAIRLGERHFPVVQQNAGLAQEDVIVTLPMGYEVDNLPEELHVSTPILRVDVAAKFSDHVLTVQKSAEDIIATVPVTDYPKFNSQMALVSAEYHQPIVLRLIAKDAGDSVKGK